MWRFLLAAAMLGSVTGLAQAADTTHDWVGITATKTDDAMSFVDLPTIKRGDDGIVTTRQSIVPASNVGEFAALTATVLIDCEGRRSRKTDIQSWRLDGTLIRDKPLSENWERTPKGSVGEAVVDFVCSVPDLSDADRFPRTSDTLPTATGRRILRRATT